MKVNHLSYYSTNKLLMPTLGKFFANVYTVPTELNCDIIDVGQGIVCPSISLCVCHE